ncbi:hypothetical protein ACWD0J_33310 [Streptomyces sp. NPDC003011]
MRRLAIPVLSLALLAGCSAQTPSSAPSSATPSAGAPEPSASPSAPAKKGYTFRLPIAAYSYSDADYEVIQSAERVLTRDCMKDFGLSYTPAKTPAPAAGPDRRYGLSDLATAGRYGYRLPPEPAAPQPQLSKDETTVLYGKRSLGDSGQQDAKLTFRGREIPAEGCLGKAILDFRKPYEYPAGSRTASRIATASYEDSLKDPAVRAVFGKWSSCMRRKGYDYASPMDALETPAFREGKVSAEEKETAVADVSCKQNTGLLDTWFDAEAAIQKDMIAKDPEPLRKLDEMHREKVRAAREILADA